jgi:cytochrome c553
LTRFITAAACLLAWAQVALGQPSLDTCFACHGRGGISSMPFTPSLAAQPSSYVLAQLALFRSGKRTSDTMGPMAKTVAAGDVRALADALENLPAPPPFPSSLNTERYQRGQTVAAREHCDSCHQPDFSGIENAPRLAHQREDYLEKALLDFKKGARIGYGEPVMPVVAAALRDREIADLAHYLSHFRQPP